MLVNLENITTKGEQKTMHTFIDKDCSVVKGYLSGHDVKDYADDVVELQGELAYDDSKAKLFPFKMNEWEGVTTFRLQPKVKA
ncbi:MAG: hypothetical protein PHN69_08255 [Candidatus Pacebacteria bacterium]|nr:hypothetical protein [Candidatus Paceibacterota bacterium]